eukprot:Protomagalhaensia_sp_Gyna_25__26@NODE_1013_length_2293_cov_10401_455191_g534_i1_p1_GENE_NODE_1013_length_2293_cov_10401_455191_g534_i1NODE_1013_length_2293_cov_10401_455191_g534_i1_p1_ORF_typecomplete_len503_score69_61Peptidase_M16_M/PF16187_5/3e16Peptidase_M16_M/PF16187_5/33Peptidase_M16_C/PF05193_21/0_2_NODE_1013_length_2293_cov_10401_455191_g534_i11181626
MRPTVKEIDDYFNGRSALTKIVENKDQVYDGFQWYRRILLVTFMLEMIEESLNEETYDAEVLSISFHAGTKDSANPYNRGLVMTLRGYNDKASVLLEQCINQFHKFRMSGKELAVVYASLQRYYTTLTQNQEPYAMASRQITQSLGLSEWSDVELLETLKAWGQDDLREILTAEKLPTWTRTGGSMRGMVFGNVDAQTAKSEYLVPLLDLLGQTSSSKSPADACPSGILNLVKSRTILTQHGVETGELRQVTSGPKEFPACMVHHTLSLNKESPDCACVLAVQFCYGSALERDMHVLLVNNWLSNQFFDDLRTKQALGYVVGATPTRDVRGPHMRFVVQSTKPSLFLLKRIEHFIRLQIFGAEDAQDLTSVKLNLTEDQFAVTKAAVISSLKAAPKSIAEQQSRYAATVLNETLDFEHRKKGISYIESLDMKRFATAVDEAFVKGAWFAVCLDSPQLENPQASIDLVVNTYLMKDEKSLKRIIWSGCPDDRLQYFTTYPITP